MTRLRIKGDILWLITSDELTAILNRKLRASDLSATLIQETRCV